MRGWGQIGFALGSGEGGEPNLWGLELCVFNDLGGVHWVRPRIFLFGVKTGGFGQGSEGKDSGCESAGAERLSGSVVLRDHAGVVGRSWITGVDAGLWRCVGEREFGQHFRLHYEHGAVEEQGF
ncbi:MAG: hypothetical protein QOJ99_3604 [Bryobacterales bacterium]|jgi:hypothetical protein|nr:hypothetical protein [Bryobacterales bacterium]